MNRLDEVILLQGSREDGKGMYLRNRLPATIKGVRRGKLNAHVNLEWNSLPLSVIVTSASADEMGLAEGDEVDVLFKASDVILAKNVSGEISARNVLPGRIDGIVRGFPLAMVSVNVMGRTVDAEITLSSLEGMGLAEGDEIEAVIKSTELILARRR